MKAQAVVTMTHPKTGARIVMTVPRLTKVELTDDGLVVCGAGGQKLVDVGVDMVVSVEVKGQ